MEGNLGFDCDTLEQYKKLSVLSDCGKTPEELEEERAKLPTTAEPDQVIYKENNDLWIIKLKECDIGCQAERRARELHEYIKRLWEMIKEKLGKVAKQNGLDKFAEDVENFFREDVGGFFSDVGQKISNFHFWTLLDNFCMFFLTNTTNGHNPKQKHNLCPNSNQTFYSSQYVPMEFC